ncbi:TIGR02099 family protein [Sinimarinibacterium sp. CAU 1509]|uniref:YhdP family protein n=1 Tax=Sinimarinibacterium sp. CAU 1509 TaxID=2562283 RepID=UPI0010AC243B|nr:YhdP family protein [Sinimarinibacterium sp. CAU 1509]TJY56763.1 TIGR02099 family protein [Sinimarinibacterium sp. CAU 1509]
MERVKRRWWTWAISLITTTVLTGAVLSGLFQLAVLAIPSYREELANWVSDATGRPVQIGGISLAWSGLSPRFDLTGITLYSDDGDEQLRVERLSIGISVMRLLTGNVVPTRLVLAGLRVSAEVDEQRRIRIAGFEPGDGDLPLSARREQWLRDLERFKQVRLEDCELRVLHPAFADSPLTFAIEHAELAARAGGFELDAALLLPPDRGGKVQLEAEIDGSVAQLRSWQGRFDLEVDGLVPQGWLRPWLLAGTQIGVADLQGEISGDITEGRITRARMAFDSGPMVLARAGVLSSAQQTRAVVDYLRDPRGWRVDVTDLSFDDALLLHGSLRRSDLDGVAAYDLDADRLNLTQLSPWLGIWRDAPAWTQTAGRSSGLIEGLVARVRVPPSADPMQPTTPRYSVRAQLNDAGLRADRNFGVAGIAGELTADENGGQVQLSRAPMLLKLPQIMESDLSFDAFSAVLRWTRTSDSWRISADSFDWQLAGTQGQGQLSLDLPADANASPVLTLQAEFSGEDATAAKGLMPRHWPDSLKRWLSDAIVAGRVPHGALKIEGPLHDFPFVNHPTGAWNLDLDVTDGALEFLPDWPRIEGLAAQLHFTGSSLGIFVDHGSSMGNAVKRAEVRFDDFAEQRFSVSASLDGELSQFYAYLRASPLRKVLRGLLDHTEASGAAAVALQLDIPLQEHQMPVVHGTVDLNDAQLKYTTLDPAITGLNGQLAFDNEGVRATALKARYADVPLRLRIDPQDGTRGVVRGSFAFTPKADGSGASKYIPEILRPRLHGASGWNLELPLKDTDSELLLSSDLSGTVVDLPQPLGKPGDVTEALTVRVHEGRFAPVAVDLAYGDRFGVALEIGPTRTDGRDGDALAGLSARVGTKLAPPVQAGRFLLDGRVAQLDVESWIAVITAGDHGGVGLDSAEIETDQLIWGAQSTLATRLRYQPLSDGWRTDFSGEGVGGSVVWTHAGGDRVVARLDHLGLKLAMPAASASPAAATPTVTDPASLPVLDIQCQALRVGTADLGRLNLRSERVPGGQRLIQARLAEGIVDLSAGGQWRRTEGQSTANLKFDLNTTDIDALLQAFDYAPSLQAERTQFLGDLNWHNTGTGLDWRMASGRIDVDANKGQLRAVQPGASRVLGLINFYALPRRLTLNFDDVVGDGLAFDTIKGHFELANGVAHTDDLHMEAPSLRMDVRGAVGIAARDYDQRVTVYPDVSAGVTLGAVLLGGPVVGGLVLLAQELLDKPLDQVTQLSYRITGSWDNPKVEKLDSNSP